MADVDLSYALTGFPLEKVVVIDTETTGLDPYGGDEIVSIGICSGRGEKLYYSLVKPTRRRAWKDAKRVHGISPLDVKNAPRITQIADDIRAIILGDTLIVGYNVGFDLSMLHAAGVIEEMPGAYFDVMRQYATVHGARRARYGRQGYEWSKLEVCARHYGYVFPAHNSIEDAVASAFCYRSLLTDIEWAKSYWRDFSPFLKRVSLNQNKESSANVKSFVSSGVTSSTPAELRLGSITRGVNKGAPRYECFVNDVCVGVQGFGDLDGIKRLYMVADDEDLPRVIECRALMSVTNGKPRCSAAIVEDGRILDEVEKAAPKKPSAIVPPEVTQNEPLVSAPVVDREVRIIKKPKLKVIGLGMVAAFAIFMSVFGLTQFEFSIPWLMTEMIFLVPAVILIRKIQGIVS